jgi:uncharacterized membrane protein (UPF0127 family)
MPRRATTFLVFVLVLLPLAGCAGAGVDSPASSTEASASPAPASPTPASTQSASTPGRNYATTTVELVDEDGTRLATVDAWVADTWMKRYTGLSDTGALRPGQGMLFVHDEEATHGYVMRNMDFPLDMVFVASDGTITTIHHAPLESGGDLTEYSGRAKYVLEVPMGYTNETGVEVGDGVRIGDV